MEMFKDKTFEEMDEISQMIEPFEAKINVELSQFPDELILDADYFLGLVEYNRSRLQWHISDDVRKMVERKASSMDLRLLADTARTGGVFIDDFFEITIEENTTYNASTNELKGEVKVIKKKIAYEDKEIEKIMKDYIISTFNKHFNRKSDINKSRLNEILDLFNVKEGLADRGSFGKINKLEKHYKNIIDDRTLNIRDVELFKRFIEWNVKYIKNGNLPALGNITKLKIMMRKGLPIYSIKEDIT